MADPTDEEEGGGKGVRMRASVGTVRVSLSALFSLSYHRMRVVFRSLNEGGRKLQGRLTGHMRKTRRASPQKRSSRLRLNHLRSKMSFRTSIRRLIHFTNHGNLPWPKRRISQTRPQCTTNGRHTRRARTLPTARLRCGRESIRQLEPEHRPFAVFRIDTESP